MNRFGVLEKFPKVFYENIGLIAGIKYP